MRLAVARPADRSRPQALTSAVDTTVNAWSAGEAAIIFRSPAVDVAVRADLLQADEHRVVVGLDFIDPAAAEAVGVDEPL